MGKLNSTLQIQQFRPTPDCDLDLSSSVLPRSRAVSANFTSYSARVSETGESPSCDLGRFGVCDRARGSKSNLVCCALFCFGFVSCCIVDFVSCRMFYSVPRYDRCASLSHPSSCMLVNHGPSQQSSKEEYKPWK